MNPSSNAFDATRPAPYRPGRSLIDSLDAAHRLIRAAVTRTVNGEGDLAELARLAELQRQLQLAVDAVATHLLTDADASYREVGAALGLTRQAVQHRYPTTSARPAGGQESRWR